MVAVKAGALNQIIEDNVSDNAAAAFTCDG
jgi:hypothetical protein